MAEQEAAEAPTTPISLGTCLEILQRFPERMRPQVMDTHSDSRSFVLANRVAGKFNTDPKDPRSVAYVSAFLPDVEGWQMSEGLWQILDAELKDRLKENAPDPSKVEELQFEQKDGGTVLFAKDKILVDRFTIFFLLERSYTLVQNERQPERIEAISCTLNEEEPLDTELISMYLERATDYGRRFYSKAMVSETNAS